MITFGLTNTPAAFINVMNRVFEMLLDKIVVAFIEDILLYLKTLKGHTYHLRTILEVLRKNELYAKLEKCDFWLDKVAF